MTTALIDGDAIAYILGWRLRINDPATDEMFMQSLVDSFMRTTMELLDATHYVGALSTSPTFRHDVYKYAKYKGHRKPDVEAIAAWKPLINAHLMREWQFCSIDFLEADDIVSWMAFKQELGERIICSPDKDLAQIPGKLYNYQKGEMSVISSEQAEHNFKMQLITGDVTDNIKGVPGLGEKKAEAKLKEGVRPEDLYRDYFGDYYGTRIYAETLCTVQLLRPGHPYETYFDRRLDAITPIEFQSNVKELGA